MKRVGFLILCLSLMLAGAGASGAVTSLPQKKPHFTAAKKSVPAEKPAAPKDTAAKPLLPEKKSLTSQPPATAAETSLTPATAAETSLTPVPTATALGSDALPLVDTEQKLPLPDYPPGARLTVGKDKAYIASEEDTMIDIARHFGLGYVEMRGANPQIDPWAPVPGADIDIPLFTLLPRARQEGIVVNLGKMRLYYFKDKGKPPLSYAIGIGREGLQTPVGDTTVVRKGARPSWFPTGRMRLEKPWLPAAVPPGASNPLGEHALYLGWPTFLIHGSNKPWGIGRRVSSGCMRMYPEDIKRLFDMVPVGMPVTVVDQPILIAWVDDTLYLEANPTQTQSVEVEVDGHPEKIIPPSEGYKKEITRIAGEEVAVDWYAVERAFAQRTGRPVIIAMRGDKKKVAAAEKKQDEDAPRYIRRPGYNR